MPDQPSPGRPAPIGDDLVVADERRSADGTWVCEFLTDPANGTTGWRYRIEEPAA